MGPVRFQETLRRLAIFDERFVPAGLAGDLAGPSVLDARTVALLQVAVSVAIGSSAVCLQRSTARPLVSRKWSGYLRQSQLTIR